MPVGPCKTESSQKPVPIHPLIVEALVRWREIHRYRKLDDGFSRAAVAAAASHTGSGDPAELHPSQGARTAESRRGSDGTPSDTLTRLS